MVIKETDDEKMKQDFNQGRLNADKKWMGQYFHKKCLRKLKKGAKKML